MYLKKTKLEKFKNDLKIFIFIFMLIVLVLLISVLLLKPHIVEDTLNKRTFSLFEGTDGEGEGGGQEEAEPSWFLEAILKAVYGSLWFLIIQPILCLIYCCDWIVKYLATGLTNDIIFGGDKFDITKIPTAFWVICAIAGMCAVLIFFFQFMTTSFNEEMPVSLRLTKSIKSTGRAIFFVLLIPVFFFIMSIISRFLIDAVNVAFSSGGQNLADVIFGMGYSLDNDLTNLLTDRINNHAGQDDFKWLWERYSLSSSESYEWRILLNTNYIVVILCSAFTVYTAVMMAVTIVQKVFELILLFVSGPLVAATMTNDDGRRMNMWKDEVIAKSLASWGAIFAYNIWIMVINISLAKFNADITNSFLRQFILIVLIVGGALFSLGVSTMIASFIGDGVGAREGMGQMRSMGHLFGMGAVGLGVLKKASGLGNVRKRKKDLKSGGLNPLARSGGNMLGNSNEEPESPTSQNEINSRTKATGIPAVAGKGLRVVAKTGAFVWGLGTGRSLMQMGSVAKKTGSATANAARWVGSSTKENVGNAFKGISKSSVTQDKINKIQNRLDDGVVKNHADVTQQLNSGKKMNELDKKTQSEYKRVHKDLKKVDKLKKISEKFKQTSQKDK